MDAIKARVKATGETIEGFLDGKGHFDVPVDHCEFERYDVEELEIKPEFDIEAEVKKWYKEHFKPTRPYKNYSGFYLEKKTILDLANRFYELGRQYK